MSSFIKTALIEASTVGFEVRDRDRTDTWPKTVIVDTAHMFTSDGVRFLLLM